MEEVNYYVREKTATFNSGLNIINRLDEEFKKIKFAYMSRDGYSIVDSLERLYSEVWVELTKDEQKEGDSKRSSCNKIIDELNSTNENRQDKILTKPILLTRKLKDELFKFELWIREKLKEKGMMMPSKDVEDAKSVMGKM